MQRTLSQTLLLSLAFSIASGFHSGSHAFSADELQFQILGGTNTGPSGDRPAAMQPRHEPAPEGFPDFQVLGPPPVEDAVIGAHPATAGLPDARQRAEWKATAAHLNFTVLGPPAAAMPKPLIYVYSAPPGMICLPCHQLARHASQLPYALEWRTPPLWVQAFPTLHWQAANGQWRKCEGWPGAAQFRRMYEETQKTNPIE